MSSRIRILPEEMTNRIAAGEVVERPSSVVKELVENAIDAGAESISVELAGCGIDRIRVADDGVGMAREDALLAFQRYATSKLPVGADLFSVDTLGFRGEALPSIAAVSRVRLATSSVGEEVGTELCLEGGRVSKVRDAGLRPGTVLEIEDLFYNTPVRRKFLRSKASELSHVAEVVTQAALSHPKISFRLTHEERLLADFPSVKSTRYRLLQVLGERRSADLIEGEFSAGKLSGQAFLSRPTATQGSRKDQFFLVNRRPVRHPLLIRALYDAYETLLRSREHPFFLLSLMVEPTLVDINVHPAKREVRFSEELEIYPILRSQIRAILLRQGESPLHTTVERPVGSLSPAPVFGEPALPGEQLQRGSLLREEPAESYASEPLAFPAPSRLRVLGQVYETFLLIEVNGDFAIIDQHTAHERVLYEELLGQINRGGPLIQPLLLPVEVGLSPAERTRLSSSVGLLGSLGLQIEPASASTFWIRSVPALSSGADPERLLRMLLEEIEEIGSEFSLSERTRRLAATLACHSAVRAGRSMRLPEIEALLADLLKTEAPYTCPHGRPILIRYPREALERQFHRR